MAKVPTIEENDDGWSDWLDLGWRFRTLCCSCSYAHDEEYKVVDGKLLCRFSVNNKSTAAARRTKKKKK